MALFLVDALCTSDRPDQLVLTFNEAVLQVDPSLANDALHLANYELFDNLTLLSVRIYTVEPYGPRAVLLTVGPLSLGLDRYDVSCVGVTATNGDEVIGNVQHLLNAGGIPPGDLGVPTIVAAGPQPPTPPLPWYRVELGYVWQDAAGTVPATLDGDPVGRLDDRSGNGMHLIQVTGGLRPLLKLNVQNGKPGLLFDGVNDVLARVGLIADSPTIGSGFVVTKNAAAAFPSYSGCFTDQSPSDNDIMFTGNSGTTSWYNGGRFSNTFTGLMYVDGVQTWDMVTLNAAHANVGVVTGAIGKAVGNDGGVHYGLQIGQDRNYGGRYWAGYIFEAGLFAVPLTNPDRAALDTYLQSYWGTP